MLSNGFAGPLALKRKRSNILLAYLVCLHGLAGWALLQPLDLISGVRLLLWFMLITSAMYHRRHARHQRDNVQYWIWRDNGNWQYGDELQIWTLHANRSISTPWFAMVTLTCCGRRPQRLLFVRDQLDPDTFRRLCVRMKLSYDVTEARGRDVG